jgi:DNA-directed RNA polymerase specialized sigma24 family protein
MPRWPRLPALTPSQAELAADHWHFARNLTRSYRDRRPDLARDLEGEAALALCRAAGRCPHAGALVAYLRRAVPGVAINLMRREARHDHDPLPDDL